MSPVATEDRGAGVGWGGGRSLECSEGQAELVDVKPVWSKKVGGALSHALAQPERREGYKESTGDGGDGEDNETAEARGGASCRHLGWDL